MAQTVSTTGIGCRKFATMYFAAGKKLDISMKLLDLHNIFYTSAAEIKIVQLDLLGVAVVFFSFVSYLQIRFSLYIFIDQLASTLI